MKLSGNVKNAFDGKPEKGVVVMLYDAYGDSLPYKKVPSYFAKTKDDGSYKINNIKAGTYKAFALKDINSNFLFDSPDELIGFSDTLIKITKKTSLNFILFKEIPYKQKLKKASVPEHGHLVFAFAKPVSDSLKLNFISQEPKENVIYEYSNEKDTLHYWFADDLKDTMKIILTDGKKFKDTVRLKPITLEQAKTAKRGEKWQLKVKMNVSKDKLFDLNKEIEIRFNHPLNESLIKHKEKYFEQMDDFDKVLIKEDSTTCDSCEIYAGNKHSLGPKVFGNADALFIHRVIREYSESKTSNDVKTAGWSFGNRTWKENTRYNIFVPPATVTDIFGLINDTIKIDFKTQEEKYYGTLKLNFKIKIKKFILQLVNEKGEVFEEEDILSDYDKGIFYYKYLPPGTYNLRVIYDTNGDGLWTTGNYLKKQQPEKIIYYSKPITIRSNWDLEMEWKVE